MSERLLSISAYSRATALPASALRYYDEIGLLRPEHVDQSTGYRYYSSATVELAKVVSALRVARVPVDVMRSIVEGPRHDTAPSLRRLAAEQRDSSTRAARDLEALAARLDSRTTVGSVSVNGPELADALRAAMNQCGLEAPWDRIVLAAEPSGLDVVATNTFSLFCHHRVAASDGYGRAAIRRSAVWDLAAWLDRRATATITFSDPPIRIQTGTDTFTTGLAGATDYADHLALLPPNLTVRAQLTVDRGMARAAIMEARTDVVDLVVRDQVVRLAAKEVGLLLEGHEPLHLRFSRHLLEAALRALAGTSARVDLSSNRGPCLLRATVQPHRMVVLMPVRPS